MFQRMDRLFILSILLLLCNSLESLTSIEKIAHKYWLNKRDIKEFRRKMKGINLAQDEFLGGVMSHLPEVKTYLQREFLENAVRVRENYNQNYSSKKIESNTNSDGQRLTFSSPWVENQNDSELSDKRIKYGYDSKSKHPLEDDIEEYFNGKKIIQGDVNNNQESRFNTFQKETSYSKVVNNRNNDEKRMQDRYAYYHIRNSRSNKVKEIKMTTEEQSTRNTEGTNDQDFMNDKSEDDDSEIPGNVHFYEDGMNNDDDVGCYNGEGNDIGIDNRGTNDQLGNEDLKIGAVHSSTERIKNSKYNNSKEKFTVVLKTNIGLCSVWIVGMFLILIVLTCGCFVIFLVCLEPT